MVTGTNVVVVTGADVGVVAVADAGGLFMLWVSGMPLSLGLNFLAAGWHCSHCLAESIYCDRDFQYSVPVVCLRFGMRLFEKLLCCRWIVSHAQEMVL
jgi:hypothetical protein